MTLGRTLNEQCLEFSGLSEVYHASIQALNVCLTSDASDRNPNAGIYFRLKLNDQLSLSMQAVPSSIERDVLG